MTVRKVIELEDGSKALFESNAGAAPKVTPIQERAAIGTKGFLMRQAGGGHFFRVYKENGDFTDYDIMHYDMEVMILEDSAVFVERNGDNYIDYSAKVLGYADE